MAVVYATAADLAAYTEQEAPADADQLLARASRLITSLIGTAVYQVDTAGAPTEQGVIDALRDATCEQAAWFVETGDPSGAAGQYTSVSIGSVSLGGATTGTSAAADRVAPDVPIILAAAGLLAGPVQVL